MTFTALRQRVAEHVHLKGNFALALLALAPTAAAFLVTGRLLRQDQLVPVLAQFYFKPDLTGEAAGALYVYGIAYAGFFTIAIAAIAFCLGTQLTATPPTARRYVGFGLGLFFAVGLAILVLAEPWSWTNFRTPDFMFSDAFERALILAAQKTPAVSQPVLDTFAEAHWIFRKAIAVVIAAFTCAAAASAACASPPIVRQITDGNLARRYLSLQMARHHRVFYAASLTLLAFLLVSKARLDLYQSFLDLDGAQMTAKAFGALRGGLEIYWGAILSLSLAAVYVPTALVLHLQQRRFQELTDGPAAARGDQADLPLNRLPDVMLRVVLILLPSLFSGGIGELLKSVLQK